MLLLHAISFLVSFLYIAISVLLVVPNLVPIIVIFVIYGCQMMKVHTIVLIVAFAVLVEERISGTVMTVECVLIPSFLMITIVKLVNTCLTAQCVKKICLAAVMPPMKCPVDMPSIGIVLRN